jgi:hypothetical protein
MSLKNETLELGCKGGGGGQVDIKRKEWQGKLAFTQSCPVSHLQKEMVHGLGAGDERC